MSGTWWRRVITSVFGVRHPRGSVRDLDGLTALLSDEAAYLTQRVTTEFLRLRAGTAWERLMREPGFAEAVETCRWEGYAAMLGDVAETTMAELRRRGTATDDACALVAEAGGRALDRYAGQATHADWPSETERLGQRLARSGLAAPRPAHEIAKTGAERVYVTMPLRTDLGRMDREIVVNNLRFGLASAHGRIETAVDWSVLVVPAKAAAGDR